LRGVNTISLELEYPNILRTSEEGKNISDRNSLLNQQVILYSVLRVRFYFF